MTRERRGWWARGWAGVALLTAACGGDATGPDAGRPDGGGPGVDTVATAPAAPAIAWIARTPRIAAPTTLDAGPEAGWPAPGDDVQWTATILLAGEAPAPGARYTWRVDGVVVDEGTQDVPSGSSTLVLQRTWRTEPETIQLRVEAPGSPPDSLTIGSRDLSLTLWSTPELDTWMEASPDHPPFPLWARDQVDRWNETLASGGVQDRIRLDQVETWRGADYPDPDSTTTDLQWWFREGADARFLQVGTIPQRVRDQTIVLHELLHQRGIVDLYAYTIYHGRIADSEVRIVDPDGSLAVGSARLPAPAGVVWAAPERMMQTLMGADYIRPTRVSPHTAWGLNQWAGRRTPWRHLGGGFRSLLAMEYDYAARVPGRMDVTLADGGEPLAGYAVDVFFDMSDHATYQDVYTEEPQLTLTADETGTVRLPPEMWSEPSWAKRRRANVVILRARAPDGLRWGYGFLPSYDLTMAYLRGSTEQASFAVEVDVR